MAYAEFDKFPSTVLKHHYPDIPNLGDVTKITDEVLKSLGHIDVVVGGSPCQDLSIAGKRAGLSEGTRSNLFHEQMRIFHAARYICGARFLLWENVPGAFSSNEGRDFATVVGEMAGFQCNVPPDGWENTGVAVGKNGLCEWSVLDAQWFGVPQRRRRVFALLDTGDWSSRSPILFEPESMRGDSPPSREKRETVTTCPNGCLASGKQTTATLMANAETKLFLGNQEAFSGDYHIVEPIALAENTIGRQPENGGNGDGFTVGGPMYTLNATGCHGVAMAFKERAGCDGGGKGFLGKIECAFTLSTMKDQSVAVYENQRGELNELDITPPVQSKGGKPGQGYQAIRHGMSVRRLTPIECERLQGFPDNYTQIPYRNKPADKCPDGARYKALGNSMAVPVMRWIGERFEAITL